MVILPLDEIYKVSSKYGAMLMVDDVTVRVFWALPAVE